MKTKKVQAIALCLLFVFASGSSVAGIGSDLKKLGRKVDPTRGAKKVWKEVERAPRNIERYAKNPSDLLRRYLDFINPIKAIEETSRSLGKLAGGSLGRFAKKVQKESGRVNADLDVAVEGASDALQLSLTHPKEGGPRLVACLYTICASEIVLYKRAERIKSAHRKKYLAMVKRMEAQQSQELRNLVEQRIRELRSDLEMTMEQIRLSERAFEISGLIKSRMAEAQRLDEEDIELSQALSTPAVKKIGSELISQMISVYGNPLKVKNAQVAKYREIEDQLAMIALNANIEFEVLIAALADSMALEQAKSRKSFENAQNLNRLISNVLTDLQQTAVDLEMEIQYETARLEGLGQ